MYKTEYVHKVQYYETDKMGITHHSNYIRWMEEARVELLSDTGWDYLRLEQMGVVSAVVSVSCDYKRPTTFSDLVTVTVSVSEFNGVTMRFVYSMVNSDGAEVASGTSLHAFIGPDGKPVAVKRKYPELYESMRVSLLGDGET